MRSFWSLWRWLKIARSAQTRWNTPFYFRHIAWCLGESHQPHWFTCTSNCIQVPLILGSRSVCSILSGKLDWFASSSKVIYNTLIHETPVKARYIYIWNTQPNYTIFRSWIFNQKAEPWHTALYWFCLLIMLLVHVCYGILS